MRIHRQTHIPVLLALLLGGAGASGLQAQESNSPLSYLFKIRLGLTAGDIQTTHFDNKLMGIGAEVRYDMPAIGGALIGELTFEYVPGRNYETDMFKGVVDGMRAGRKPQWAQSWDQEWTLTHTQTFLRSSFDNRREGGAGLNLRLAYSAPMPKVFGSWVNDNIAGKMDWFAGLGIDRFKVRSEVKFFMDLRTPPSTGNPVAGQGQYDGNLHNVEESRIVPGFFAGIKYRHSQYLGFEMSLRNFGMYHYEFIPASYYSTNPSDYGTGNASDGTSRGFALEFAITAKI